VIEIETRTAGVTVSAADPLIVPKLAVTVALPCVTPVARPSALIVAMEVAEDNHVHVLVRFCVLPSLYVPVAVNCWASPAGTDTVEGINEIETNTGETVSVADPFTPSIAAVMVEDPDVTLVARPVPLTVATEVAEDVHVAMLVMF